MNTHSKVTSDKVKNNYQNDEIFNLNFTDFRISSFLRSGFNLFKMIFESKNLQTNKSKPLLRRP